MRTTFGVALITLVAGLAGHLAATPAGAQLPPNLTFQEYRCLTGTGDRLGVFVKSKASCIQRCVVDTRQSSGPYGDCFSPYGGRTASCVAAAEAKAREVLVDRCEADCPECQTIEQCTTGDPLVLGLSSGLDIEADMIFCTEAGGQTPTDSAARCESTVVKSLSRFIDKRIDCYLDCFAAVARGALPFAACTAPVSDPRTTACLAKAEANTVAKIDGACAPAGSTPSCYTTYDTGGEWVGALSDLIDTLVGQLACTD